MGRHVNFADEQERWLNKADKLNRNQSNKSERLEDRDPMNLNLAEQFEMAKRKQKLREKEGNVIAEPKVTKRDNYISHYTPKTK